MELSKESLDEIRNELFAKYQITPPIEDKAEKALILAMQWSSRIWEIESYFKEMTVLFLETEPED